MVDPARFNDRLAFVTSWTPASNRTSKSVDATLTRRSDGTLSYAVDLGEVLKGLLFVLLGLLIVYAWLFSETRVGRVLDEFFETDWMSLIFGIGSLGAGMWMVHGLWQPQVFDKRKGWYWRGWRTPYSRRRTRFGSRAVRLELIHAIQLLTKDVEYDSESYVLHELNLVLRDGDRISLRCHGDQAQLRSEARQLSRYLDVSVWDASEAR